MLARRQFVAWSIASAAAAITGCAPSKRPDAGEGTAASDAPSSATAASEDFSARFAEFEPADEPNGDLSKVEWQSFVTDGEVRSLYEFQITHGELMRYMPCCCGCGGDAGHHNNRDCYVREVRADGSVVLDSMAPT